MSRIARRLALASLLAVLTTLITAGAAFAHVTVQPGSAPQGGFTELNFRVPNERDDSGTTTLEVHFPTETPIGSVRVQPIPGWEYQIEMVQLDEPVDLGHGQITEAVGTITWTGGPIRPGEYQDFPVSAGPLPEGVDQLVFPALQTYESGEVVRWIEEPTNGEEPEHPAPVLQLTAAEDGAHGGAGEEGDGSNGAAADESDAASAQSQGAITQEDLDAASQRGTIGIVLGSLGLLLGAAAVYLSTRRRGPGSMGEAG